MRYENADHRTKIGLFDAARQRLAVYEFDSLQALQSTYHPRFYHLTTDDIGNRLSELFKLRNRYIATGKTEKYKYTLLSDSLQMTGSFGTYQPKPAEAIPDMQHVIANYGNSTLSDDRKYLVEVIYNAGVLTFYDLEARQKLWEYCINELNYTVKGNSIINIGVMGYLSASIADGRIYALYVGEKENPDEMATYGKELHVFDYSGKLLGKYNLQTPVFAICAAPAQSKLYALSHIPEPNIYIYPLPLPDRN